MSKKKSQSGHNLRVLGIIAAIAALLSLFWCFMVVNACILNLRRATVRVKDLPAAFSGATLLYLADIDICGLNTPERAAEAVRSMQRLNPDLLIMGGDYTSRPLGDVLDNTTDYEGLLQQRERFFRALADFNAPMGKFALCTREDEELGSLRPLLVENGFIPLNGARYRLRRGGDTIWLAGVTTDDDIADGAALFNRKECVICVADTPECFARILTTEAKDSGTWADLCLTGHTHAGQIWLFGRSALELTPLEQQFLYGWVRESGVPMLTTAGMGCEGVNIRLGTQPEAWLITLMTA